ncbi:MAG: UDP-N-acetylmuramate dehydrogenase [Desulfobacterales bacterium]|nr:UDP-N-acetylmuramate dehydrogenase [Desulfobacterales bacterium]
MFPKKNKYSLKSLNRIRIGGKASYYVVAINASILQEVIKFSSQKQIPFYILGAGSNVVISDEDFDGIVIRLGGELESIAFDAKQACVTARAGASLMNLGFRLARLGYLGYTYMAVIPGTIGGAVRMNAGTTKEGEIKDHFVKARVLDPSTCEVVEYEWKDMGFGYRESAISNTGRIILQAAFRLKEESGRDVRQAMKNVQALLASRREKQPRNRRTFGSTFKRPPGGKPAGWYLERVGMKGMRVGNAMVAKEHANWILNIGEARSADVKAVIDIGQKRVFEEYGVMLSREVIYLPEDMEQWD